MTVLDASVVVKWIVREPGHEEARLVSVRAQDVSAPSHIVVEVGRALLRHARAGPISHEDVRRALSGVLGSVRLIGADVLIQDAYQIAATAHVTIYDALYVAAAVRQDCEMVRADARLTAGLRGTRWDGRAILIADWLKRSGGGRPA